MSNDILCCDACGEDYRHTAIIRKPKFFGYEGKVHLLATTNSDNRSSDNICLPCLQEEIKSY